MLDGHYTGLFAAYGAVVALTLLGRSAVARVPGLRPIWPAQGRVDMARPWLDLGLFFVAVIGVIAIGQVFQRGLLLPTSGPLGPVFEALNQVIIFLPIPVLLLARRQGPRTVLLPGRDSVRRLAAGGALAVVAALVFVLVTPVSLSAYGQAFAGEAREGSLAAHAVQVFMQDLAIAALLVRLAAAIRSEWGAGIAVACLFAAAHIPAMLGAETPVEPIEWAHRGLDAALGVIVMVGLLKTRDLLWLFPTHFAMDMAQFA